MTIFIPALPSSIGSVILAVAHFVGLPIDMVFPFS
jgi:hypothetical protein